MAVETCERVRQNLDKSKCTKLPGVPVSMLTVSNSFELTEEQIATEAALKTALQTVIKASYNDRGWKWPKFSNGEDVSEETIYSKTPFGTRKIRDGNYGFRFMVSKSLCLHKKMFSHSSNEGRVIPYDKEGRIWLTKKSNGKYTGFTVDMLNVEKMKISFGDVLTETPIEVWLSDNLELDENGYLIDCPFNELEPLTSVVLEVTDVVDSDNFKVTVTQECDGTRVSGLVLADFTVLTAAGAAQAPDTVTEPNDDGEYLFTRAANFITGSVNLKAPSAVSIDAYESTGAQTVTIP